MRQPYVRVSRGSCRREALSLSPVSGSTWRSVSVGSHLSQGVSYDAIQLSRTSCSIGDMQTSVRLIKNVDDSLHFFSTEQKRGVHYVPCKVRMSHLSLHPSLIYWRWQVSCDQCRSPLFDEGRNTVLAYPSSFKFKDCKVPKDFQPTAHIFYSQRCIY